MSCPDPDAIVAYVEHELPVAERRCIDEHLDGCSACRQVVAMMASSVAESVREVGRYRLGRLIDAGGMGLVYEAFDPKLSRRVAIKMLHPGRSRRGELRREAMTMAGLNHPGVARVFDVGRAGERDFIVMELFEGGTVLEWLEERERTQSEIFDAFAVLADGLAAVHELGLVHRDVKPANILVRDEGTLVLCDFGLSTDDGRATDDASVREGDARQTQSGLAGTPAYMAPEQGRGELATARSDQYSFALCLVEALTGRRDALRRLSARLRRVLTRALSDDPSDRHPSIRALWGAVRGSLRGRRVRWAALAALSTAVLVAAVASADRAVNSCAADRTARAQQLRALAAKTPGHARLRDYRAQLDSAVDQWQRQAAETCELEPSAQVVVMRCLERQHGRLETVMVGVAQQRPGATRHWRRTLELADPQACENSAQPYAEEDRALQARIDESEILGVRGEYPAAVAIVDAVIREAKGAPPDPILPRALRWRATLWEQQDEFDAALADARWAYEEAAGLGQDAEVAMSAVLVGILLSRSGRGDPQPWLDSADAAVARLDSFSPRVVAKVTSIRANLAAGRGDFEHAVGRVESALERLEREPGDHANARADLYVAMASAQFNLTRYEQARESVNQGIGIYVEGGQQGTPVHVSAMMLLARIAGGQGHFDEELRLLEQCRDLVKPDTAVTVRVNLYEGLGAAYRERGRYGDAQIELEAALQILERHDLRPDYDTIINNSLGWVHIQAEAPDQAIPVLERALIAASEADGELSADGALSAVAKGVALSMTGDEAGAERTFREAVSVLTEAFGSNAPQTVWARQLQARALAERDPTAARRTIRDSIETLASTMGETSPFLVTAYRDEAEVSEMLGDKEAARSSYRKALEVQSQLSGPDHPVTVKLRSALEALETSGDDAR